MDSMGGEGMGFKGWGREGGNKTDLKVGINVAVNAGAENEGVLDKVWSPQGLPWSVMRPFMACLEVSCRLMRESLSLAPVNPNWGGGGDCS